MWCFVAIGVPILLAYVYGVVPISLCRSGGCGVTTSGKGGVRFEFDEDNETAGTIGQHLGLYKIYFCTERWKYITSNFFVNL